MRRKLYSVLCIGKKFVIASIQTFNMTTSSSDMSLMDLLFDREDPLLKNGIKDESFIDETYGDDNITVSDSHIFLNFTVFHNFSQSTVHSSIIYIYKCEEESR